MADETTRKKRRKRSMKKDPKKIIEDKYIPIVRAIKCNKNFVNVCPLITKDSKHIICSCDRNVVVFRTKTGIAENMFKKHKFPIHSLFINEKDPSQVISCSRKEIYVWDYKDLEVHKRIELTIDLNLCVISKLYPQYGFFKISRQSDSDKTSAKEILVQCTLDKIMEKTEIGSISRRQKALVVNNSGEQLAYFYKEKLSIYIIGTKKTHTLIYDNSHLTCVAFHPTSETVATGDKRGKIIIWHDYLKKGKSVKLHWHNSLVNDMLFTTDGNYLTSGGNEGVLVIWQLESQDKTFVPRIGGSINHLFQSTDSNFIGVSLDCNMIKILSAVNNELSKSIKFLAPAHELPAGLTYHPQTGCVVLNGRTDGELQFYQPSTDSVQVTLDVVGENLISSLKERYVYPTRVERIAFTPDGTWMATVEVRHDRIFPVERKLKIWKYVDQNKSYTLNTFVEPVHDEDICLLTFRPVSKFSTFRDMLATGGKDGYIKTWIPHQQTNNKGDLVESWQLHSICYYGGDGCKTGCFSADGSILALLFSEVTLWNSDNLELEMSLTWNQSDDKLVSIAFCYCESSQYLAGFSNNYLIVWDIKTCSIKWQMQANVRLITVDPYSKYFATFVWFYEDKKMRVYLFDPASPTPVDFIDKVVRNDNIRSAVFTRNNSVTNEKSCWSTIGSLYFVTKDTDVFAIREPDDARHTEINTGNEVVENASVFESIFGPLPKEKSANIGGDLEVNIPLGNPSYAIVKKMLATPAHVLPSVDVMSLAFMKSLLVSKQEQQSSTEKSSKRVESHAEIEEPMMKDESTNNDDDDNDGQMMIDSNGRINIELPAYDFEFLQGVLK